MAFDPKKLPTSYLIALIVSPEVLLLSFGNDLGPNIILGDPTRPDQQPQSAHANAAQARLLLVGEELNRRIPIPADAPVATSLPGPGEHG